MKKKKFLTSICALVLTVSASMTSFAGTWQFDGPKVWQWKYINDDGSYAVPGWQAIDGKWYHFDNENYLDIGLQQIDGKFYYLSRDPETAGQMAENLNFLTGGFGADGAWEYKEEAPYYTYLRWYHSVIGNNNMYGTWTSEDDALWQNQYALYGISNNLFVPYDSTSAGHSYEFDFFVPVNNLPALYDVTYTLGVAFYFHSSGVGYYDISLSYDQDSNAMVHFSYEYP